MSARRSKYFKGRQIHGDYDIRVEQAEFGEISVTGNEHGSHVTMVVFRGGTRVVRSVPSTRYTSVFPSDPLPSPRIPLPLTRYTSTSLYIEAVFAPHPTPWLGVLNLGDSCHVSLITTPMALVYFSVMQVQRNLANRVLGPDH